MILMTSPFSVLLVLERGQAHPCVLAHILPSGNDSRVIRPSGRPHWASVEVSRSRAVPQPLAGQASRSRTPKLRMGPSLPVTRLTDDARRAVSDALLGSLLVSPNSEVRQFFVLGIVNEVDAELDIA